jgi:hypothetical protein
MGLLPQALDGDMYERILEYFHTMGNALLDVSSMEKSASETIAKQADMVNSSRVEINFFYHRLNLACGLKFHRLK